MAQSNLKQQQPMNTHVFNLGGGGSHSRSLSQPTFSANNCLPPLSPFPPSESSLVASSNSISKNVTMEDMDVSSCAFPLENQFRGNDSLPPRRGHRRANSDVPLGFSDMIHSSPQLVPISRKAVLGRSETMREADDNSSKPVGLKRRDCGEISNVDSENVFGHREGVKRSAGGDVAAAATPTRHYRSISMDSGIMGKFQMGDESPKSQMDQLSPSNCLSENSMKLNFDFGHGEFNEIELKKIMADERLAEIATSDPKRAKRILANRQSAARSKERKTRYISELEYKVQILQTETTTLSAQITMLQKDYAEMTNQNNELKFRVQSMEQQAQLRDALHDALTAEVQRLKLAKMELGEEGRTSNSIAQPGPMKHHMFHMQYQQPNQVQRLPVPTSTTSTTSSTAPTSA